MKTTMMKKAVWNTIIISLILVNLFLWPYLYFEVTRKAEEDKQAVVSEQPLTQSETPEDDIIQEFDEEQEISEEKEKSFKIIDIK